MYFADAQLSANMASHGEINPTRPDNGTEEGNNVLTATLTDSQGLTAILMMTQSRSLADSVICCQIGIKQSNLHSSLKKRTKTTNTFPVW